LASGRHKSVGNQRSGVISVLISTPGAILLRFVRIWVMAVLAGLLACSSCARSKVGGRSGANADLRDEAEPKSKPIVTPVTAHNGRVARLNAAGQFVVLSFAVGYLPTTDQNLNVYRAGLKVGEVRVTEWRRDENVVADIVAGEAQPGDEVREK
jgi:hypothetical protein